MTGPRVQITSTPSARATTMRSARHHVEVRVGEARRLAVAWIALPDNGPRIGAHLSASGTSSRGEPRPYGGSLAGIGTMLVEWGVPGVRPPADLSAPMAVRWERSVTTAVLRQLRRDGLLRPLHRVPPAAPRTRDSAPTVEPKVAVMAESARPSPTTHETATVQTEPPSLHLQRLDAVAAVDHARQHHAAARRALVTATDDASPDAASARTAVDDASTSLQAAVGMLTSLNTLHRVDVSASISIDIADDGPVTTVRPRGELDMFTSPQLERACVGRVDDAPVERMVVDLSAVTFLDSSGLAVLVEIRRQCLESGTGFALDGVGERSRRLLAMTRLDTVFEIV